MLSGIVDIDRTSDISLAEQIYRQLRLAVRDRRLQEGQKLPSSRKLASALGVSRNTVIEAFKRLEAEQIISIRPNAVPTVYSAFTLEGSRAKYPTDRQPTPQISARGRSLCENQRADFRFYTGGILQSGVPSLDIFPTMEWARAMRRAVVHHGENDVFYSHSAGLPRLRTAIIDFLTHSRGVVATAEQVLICPSTQASLSILTSCLADAGDHALIENPGYLGARGAFKSRDLNVMPMPIDENGALPPDGSVSENPRLIYLTPSHQYPLGHSMTLARRLAFIDYARETGALILEDDYDSEFLFSKRPVAALQGLSAGAEVIYLGTFAKSMLPGIRVAYMIVPLDLVEPLSQAIHNSGAMANVHAQAALADFIESGEYRAHLKRIRAVYQQRGMALAAALSDSLGHKVEISMPTGGVQMAMKFNFQCDDITIARELQAIGVAVSPLSSTYLSEGQSGLIVGFSSADSDTIKKGVEMIERVVMLAS